jgi:hypothetical protein
MSIRALGTQPAVAYLEPVDLDFTLAIHGEMVSDRRVYYGTSRSVLP